MAKRSRKTRNYRQEYRRRIERGLAKGKSRADARGHARDIDLPGHFVPSAVNRESSLEQALKLMKKGFSQKTAAQQAGVSAERLRRYQKLNTESHRIGRTWVISDRRPVEVLIASGGELRFITLARDAASDVGTYWERVNRFLETNRRSYLDPFVGKGIRDVDSKLHGYEVRPNVLRRLDSAGELQFVDIYRQTTQQ